LSLPSGPPFTVPSGLGEYSLGALRRSLLLDLYEKNKQDFIDCAGIVYSVVASLQPNSFSSANDDAYSIFCDFLVTCLLAAPTQLSKPSVDDSGVPVNLFGAAITDTCFPRVTIQDLYGSDDIKTNVGWRLCLDLVRLIAIDAFAAGIHDWTPKAVLLAKNRLSELRSGKRRLRTGDGAGPYGRALH
jgi:hypothetical protein